MGSDLTNAQVDKLGERLRQGDPTEADLQLLDNFRQSFAEAYESTVAILRDRLHLEPTGRSAKSTLSIVDKLRRESIRLSQMQDIAGCRLVVPDIAVQEKTLERVKAEFGGVTIVDRRKDDSHGYRAIHIIVKRAGRPIEIQLRSMLQHIWAEFSEKCADIVDPAVKYGGGPKEVGDLLLSSSRLISQFEENELKFLPYSPGLKTPPFPEPQAQIEDVVRNIQAKKLQIQAALEEGIAKISGLRDVK